MDIFSTALILSVVGLILYFFLVKKNTGKPPCPPGPRGWEVVRASLSALNGTLPLQLEEWHRKHGDVVFCPLLTGNIVLLNSPSATRELYAGKSTEKFANDRMWSYAADRLCHRKCVTTSSPSDPGWTKMRKLVHSVLKFYGEGVAEFEKLVPEVLDETITSLDRRCGEDLLMKDVIEDFITTIIGILLSGEATDAKSELCKTIKWFNQSIMRIVDPSFSFTLRICPFLDRIPGTAHYKAHQELMNSKEAILKMILGDREIIRKLGSRPGIVDKVLEYQRNEGADWMTDDHVTGFLMDVITAGVNTSTFTLNAVFFHLLHYPKAMHAIQDELDRVVGPDRKPALSDRPLCSYTEAFVLESMRLSSILPLGLDHLVTQDVEFRGCLIPKGTVAFSASYSYNVSPRLWTDPRSFKPERFLDDEGHLLRSNHPARQSLLSFGTGKRSCVGETFARARMFLFVAGLLQSFDVLPPVREKLLPMERDSWRQGVLDCLHLKPYRCSLHRRTR